MWSIWSSTVITASPPPSLLCVVASITYINHTNISITYCIWKNKSILIYLFHILWHIVYKKLVRRQWNKDWVLNDIVFYCCFSILYILQAQVYLKSIKTFMQKRAVQNEYFYRTNFCSYFRAETEPMFWISWSHIIFLLR